MLLLGIIILSIGLIGTLIKAYEKYIFIMTYSKEIDKNQKDGKINDPNGIKKDTIIVLYKKGNINKTQKNMMILFGYDFGGVLYIFLEAMLFITIFGLLILGALIKYM